MKTGVWQPAAIQAAADFLECDPAIRALILTGSGVGPAIDAWSDLDFACVVADSDFDRFFPAIDWLKGLGVIFGFEQSVSGLKSVTRVCFDDFARMDFVIIRESDLQKPGVWDYTPEEFTILFSRSPVVALLAQTIPEKKNVNLPELQPDTIAAMSDHFWFRASLAVTKIMRDDLLIGLHLTLDLARDCLVIGMMLRDVELGKVKHRHGGPQNEIVRSLGRGAFPTTPRDMLDFIEHVSRQFETLTLNALPENRGKAAALRGWVTYARSQLYKN
jgi:hypothetical protein